VHAAKVLAEHAGTSMLRMRSTAAVAGLVPVLALAGAAVPAMARQAVPGGFGTQRHARPTARISRSPFRVLVSSHFGEPGNASGYSAIVVTGKRKAWVFGGTNPGGPGAPVAEHWNGTAMTPSALPSGLTGFISDASAPSPADVWAASEYGGYVLHWNGARWHLAMRWGGDIITGLTAISAHDVWVFGAVAGGQGTGTWHFDGRSWHRVRGTAGTIYRASAISRRDVWAITTGAKADSVMRYNGKTWLPVRTGRVLAGVVASDILAASTRDVWVLGEEVSHGTVRLVLAHWSGARWTRISTAVTAFAGRLSAGAHGTVLATATPADGSAAGLILQVNAAGQDHVVAIRSGLGSGVSAVAVMRGTRLLLASGGVLTRLGGDAVVWEGRLTRAAHRRIADDD
jgi:hypothetical protein